MEWKTRRRLLPRALLLTLVPLCASAHEVRIYVTDSGGSRIEAIDTATDRVVQVINGIAMPHGVGFSPDGQRIYVSDEAKDALDIIDRVSGRITDEMRLSGRPNNIAVTRDGSRVLVAIRSGEGGLDVVDTAARRRVRTIPTQGALHNVYLTPDGKYAIAGSIAARKLIVIDLATSQPAWEIPFEDGVRPMAIEANPDGSAKRIFVELSRLHGVAIVDFATRREVGRIILPDLPFASAGDRADEVTPCHGIAVAPNGRSLWIDSTVDNAVFAYALPDLRLLGHVGLPTRAAPGQPLAGARPNWIAFTPDSRRLFISNAALNSVSVIDAQAMKLVTAVPVGRVPKRIGTLVLR